MKCSRSRATAALMHASYCFSLCTRISLSLSLSLSLSVCTCTCTCARRRVDVFMNMHLCDVCTLCMMRILSSKVSTCVCVCTDTCIHCICIHVYIFSTCVCVYWDTCIHLYTHTCVHSQYVCACVLTHAYMCTRIHVYILSTCVYVYMCVDVYACMHVYMHTCVFTFLVHVCTCILTYAYMCLCLRACALPHPAGWGSGPFMLGDNFLFLCFFKFIYVSSLNVLFRSRFAVHHPLGIFFFFPPLSQA